MNKDEREHIKAQLDAGAGSPERSSWLKRMLEDDDMDSPIIWRGETSVCLEDFDEHELCDLLQSNHKALANHRTRMWIYGELVSSKEEERLLGLIRTLTEEIGGGVIPWDEYTMEKKREKRDIFEGELVDALCIRITG